MDANTFIEITRDGLTVLLIISAPVMIASMVIGVGIGLLQALTQIQEMTLTFVPKIVTIFFMLIFALPFMLNTLSDFNERLYERIVNIEQ